MADWADMDRDARVGAIWRMAREGVTADKMAERFGTQAQHVRKLARSEGIAIPTEAYVRHQNDVIDDNEDVPAGSMWAKPESERRMLIWERAKLGARSTRESNPPMSFPPQFTVSTD